MLCLRHAALHLAQEREHLGVQHRAGGGQRDSLAVVVFVDLRPDVLIDLLADEQIVEAVLDKINEAQTWIPDEEIYDYYRRKKPQLQKRLDNEKVIKFKSYVSFYIQICRNFLWKWEKAMRLLQDNSIFTLRNRIIL